ncbi:hypothetical protein Pyn_29499 [Prunus yedoensis var. nudiflora]|uniref:Uncharacterized protein n=1 Tax=Prunus yedoensis var. nudiflora TaxID=2094558 RepID=A0A314Y732_PRUYE|nr:hypothetical protein Pyn_29499 [Prunus yedoensis var. nudiflora]
MAKGSGMIHPNMATMLGVVDTVEEAVNYILKREDKYKGVVFVQTSSPQSACVSLDLLSAVVPLWKLCTEVRWRRVVRTAP